jgi:hypothetical protein
MKVSSNLFLLISSVILILSSCSQSLEYKKTNSVEQCESKGGYWYNSRCWKEFKDEGISKLKIDSTVVAQIKQIDSTYIEIDKNKEPIIGFLPMEEGRYMLLITVYGLKNNFKTLILPIKKKKLKNTDKEIECYALLFNGSALDDEMDEEPSFFGHAKVNIIDLENAVVQIDGVLKNEDKSITKNFKFTSNNSIVGAGNSILEIKDNEAYLSGTLGTITYHQIKDLIKNHPEIKTIVMTNISGSINDAVNMHTGRLIHENGFTTKVLSDSDIASGGVDLFCAGTKRIVEKGAKIGIHSWCCVNDMKANKLPKEHPAHKYQIEYFTMAMGKGKGPDFYFHTLEVADFDDIHYMSNDEIKKWGVATEFIDGSEK